MNPQSILVIVLQSLTLITVIYSAFRVVNRNVEEWRQREERLTMIERQVQEFAKSNVVITKVETKLEELTTEIMRVRDRLDTFLDRRVQ
jgi:biopolymer transport protein ExbB/TolQ